MTKTEAFEAIDDMLSGNKFGDAGSRVVVEQFLDGEEASFICMIDGNNILPMATSQDHKRIFEQDQRIQTLAVWALTFACACRYFWCVWTGNDWHYAPPPLMEWRLMVMFTLAFYMLG